jgi:hypothetical protein
MDIRRFYLGDDERLSYGFDWSPWLRESGLSVVDSEWQVPAGLALVAEDVNGPLTVAVLSVDGAEAGDWFTITNVITTDGAQPVVAERSFVIEVVEHKFD